MAVSPSMIERHLRFCILEESTWFTICILKSRQNLSKIQSSLPKLPAVYCPPTSKIKTSAYRNFEANSLAPPLKPLFSI